MLAGTGLLHKYVFFLFILLAMLTGCGGGSGSGSGGSTAPTTPVVPVFSYSIAGSVAGLNPNSNLTLTNNAGDRLQITGNGNFTFSQTVTTDASYSVAVSTQPTGQLCSVSSGTGKVASTNITNVVVTCASDLFSLSGTLTGLAPDTQLTLLSNYGEQITLTTNGSYQFANPVPLNAGYLVTILYQPSSQICIMQNFNASGVTANVTNLNISCSITATFAALPANLSQPVAWTRNFGGNPMSPLTTSSVSVYPNLAQSHPFSSMAKFLLSDTSSNTSFVEFAAAPVFPAMFANNSPTLPGPMKTGWVQQAYYVKDSLSSAGYLDGDLCSAINGTYLISEVAYDNSGKLTKLAADFSAACSLGYIRNMTGAIRFNSAIPAGLNQTFAVTGLNHKVTEGDIVVLDGSLSWNPTSRIQSLTWTQISGPSFDLSSCQNGICNTYAPQVAPGGASVVFQLTAASENGQIGVSTLQLTVKSWHDTQSRYDLNGDGYIASKENLHFTDADGTFEVPIQDGTEAVYPDQQSERIEFRYHGNATYGAPMIGGAPTLTLSNSLGSPLVPGSYSGTTRASYTPWANPSFDYGANGRGCNSSLWKADVAALTRNASDLTHVSQAAIWFQIQCTEGGLEPNATYGRFWINYTPVNPPTALAAGPASAAAGQTIIISDTGSTTPAGTLRLQTLRQLFGTTVKNSTFLPNGSIQLTIDPNTPAGSNVVFSYEITDSLGQAAIKIIKIPVASRAVSVGVASNLKNLVKSYKQLTRSGR